MTKETTKRAVVTVEVEIDESAISEIFDEHDGSLEKYFEYWLYEDCRVRKIISVEEFSE